jgi:phage tail sheath gpL-like
MSGSALDFRYFPSATFRPAGFFAELDASQANSATPTRRALLIGQVLSSGSAVANVPVLAYAQDQINGLCGLTSMLAMQYAAYRAQDPFGECWVLPLADNGAGTAATGSIAITGPATAAGTMHFYIAGVNIPIGVNLADTSATIAAALVAAINSGLYLTGCIAGTIVTVSATSTIPLTAVHKGAAQNDIDLRMNYLGARAGEVLPAGVTVALTAFSGGATNPVLTTALTNLNTATFDFISCPYTDTTSLAALTALLSDQSGRWAAISMLYGHVFACYKGSVGARQTFGASLNDQHRTVLSYTNSPTPVWLECADLTGAHAVIIRVNPALGVTGQPLALLAPPIADRDSPLVQDTMLHNGLSTYDVGPDGVCRINRSITTSQTNASGQPDNSYLNTNLLFQAMYAVRYMKAQLQSQFSGKILVADGTPLNPGSPATTPSLIFQASVAIYGYLASQFVVQNPQTYAKNGYAKIGAKGQVLLYMPFDFSDNVIQLAALIQFTQST